MGDDFQNAPEIDFTALSMSEDVNRDYIESFQLLQKPLEANYQKKDIGY